MSDNTQEREAGTRRDQSRDLKLGGWKSDYAQEREAGTRRDQSWDEAGRLEV